MADKTLRKISDSQIADALAPFQIYPSTEEIDKIHNYLRLLSRWNDSVGLTTVRDPIEIVGRHFGESMFSTKLLPVENCRLADVGTGAGFPGLALKIVCPAIQLILIESNKKKCAFLSEVIRNLKLTDITICPDRFEQIRGDTVHANIITSRALGSFKSLIRWSERALAHRGHLMLWVGSDDSARVAQTPGWTWTAATRLPESQRRFILIGRPIGESAILR